MSKKKIGMLICALGITLGCFTVTGCEIKEVNESSGNTEPQKTEVVQKTELPATENPLSTREAVQKTELPATANPVPSRNPMNVKENTLIFSCKPDQENTPEYDPRGGAEFRDTFFVSDDVIFLDDTLKQRILMYKKGKFVKSIDLEWNRDVKQMFYAKDENVLKVVYIDLSNRSQPCTCDILIEDGRIINDEKIEDSEYYFYREDGKLMTDYYDGKAALQLKKVYKILRNFKKDCVGYSQVFSSVDEKETMFGYELMPAKKNDTLNYDTVYFKRTILRFEGEQMVSYAVPHETTAFIDEKSIKFINGTIYELLETEDKIEIYALAEKKISDHKVEFSEKTVELTVDPQEPPDPQMPDVWTEP